VPDAVQAALDFFRKVREQPDLQEDLAGWEAIASAERLAELACRLGHPCSAADIEIAFRHDWVMRWFAGNASDGE
jgi:hypothetical protein